jgi:CheY-like chemotaxis protein
MSNYQILPTLKVAYANLDLRFLCMFAGVLVVPLIIFVNAGSVSLTQSRFEPFYSLLTVAVLLLMSLSLGALMFSRKVRSLSISDNPDQLPVIRKRILWIEEDDYARGEITALLCNAGYRVTSSGSPVEALILSLTGHYDLCLLGDWRPYEEKNKLCLNIRRLDPECPILLYSLQASQQDLQRGIEAGAWGYLTRPASDFALRGSITTLLKVALSGRQDSLPGTGNLIASLLPGI